MLRFHVDHNFHNEIIKGLRRRGVNCLSAREDQHRESDDLTILMRATVLHRVLVTHDWTLVNANLRELSTPSIPGDNRWRDR